MLSHRIFKLVFYAFAATSWTLGGAQPGDSEELGDCERVRAEFAERQEEQTPIPSWLETALRSCGDDGNGTVVSGPEPEPSEQITVLKEKIADLESDVQERDDRLLDLNEVIDELRVTVRRQQERIDELEQGGDSGSDTQLLAAFRRLTTCLTALTPAELKQCLAALPSQNVGKAGLGRIAERWDDAAQGSEGLLDRIADLEGRLAELQSRSEALDRCLNAPTARELDSCMEREVQSDIALPLPAIQAAESARAMAEEAAEEANRRAANAEKNLVAAKRREALAIVALQGILIPDAEAIAQAHGAACGDELRVQFSITESGPEVTFLGTLRTGTEAAEAVAEYRVANPNVSVVASIEESTEAGCVAQLGDYSVLVSDDGEHFVGVGFGTAQVNYSSLPLPENCKETGTQLSADPRSNMGPATSIRGFWIAETSGPSIDDSRIGVCLRRLDGSWSPDFLPPGGSYFLLTRIGGQVSPESLKEDQGE